MGTPYIIFPRAGLFMQERIEQMEILSKGSEQSHGNQKEKN
jgi:hypothetical protein